MGKFQKKKKKKLSIYQIVFRRPEIKFNFKFSKTGIELLDKTVYKNKERNKLLTTVYCKRRDRGNFLHHTSAHPRSLIKVYNHTTKSFT